MLKISKIKVKVGQPFMQIFTATVPQIVHLLSPI